MNTFIKRQFLKDRNFVLPISVYSIQGTMSSSRVMLSMCLLDSWKTNKKNRAVENVFLEILISNAEAA